MAGKQRPDAPKNTVYDEILKAIYYIIGDLSDSYSIIGWAP